MGGVCLMVVLVAGSNVDTLFLDTQEDSTCTVTIPIFNLWIKMMRRRNCERGKKKKQARGITYPFTWADTDGLLLGLDAGTFITVILLQA